MRKISATICSYSQFDTFSISRPNLAGLSRKLAAIVLLGVLALLAQPGFAQQPALNFFKNYFVTGNYAVGGVGLRGQGVNGFATGLITINGDSSGIIGVPDGADIVAAFLYWETLEKTATPSSTNGFFRGYSITGKALGQDHAAPCWSSGGATGASQGAPTLRVYRADVRPYLPMVNGKLQAKGSFQVKLPDSGSSGGGAPLTEGASLVVIYRVIAPAFPLKAVVIYDGSWTMNKSTPFMSQTIQGFYQAAEPTPGANPAKITHIVGDGQSNFTEQLSFGVNVLSTTIDGTQLDPNNPFTGAAGFSWDNPTFDVSAGVAENASSVNTQVLPVSSNFDCLSWGAVVFSTPVKDSDKDGLLDVWEQDNGYYDAKDGSWVALPGAVDGLKDIYVEIDYLTKTGAGAHSHLPKQAALDMVGLAFQNAPVDCDPVTNICKGVQVHFDVGNNYQSNPPDPYIAPFTPLLTTYDGRGGNAIEEDSITCHDSTSPTKYCEFPEQAGVVSWKGGFTTLKNQPLNYPDEATCEANSDCVRRFQHGRKDSYHYELFGHVLGLAKTSWNTFKVTLVSIVDSGNTATITTSTAHGLSVGDRISVSGAIGDFDLNGTYLVQSVPSTTSFTITTANVTDGMYTQSNEPGLTVSSGAPGSGSGWSDLGGGDSTVTLGLWRSDVAADDQVGSALVQAGTLMHELGHTLGSTHGGYYYNTAPTDYWPTYGINCKPNFQSVMNYLFQIRGLPGGTVDYSDRILKDLNEGSLVETNGLGSVLAKYGTRWYAPLSFVDQVVQNTVGGHAATMHCDGTPLLPTDPQMVRVEGATVINGQAAPIDWNNDSVVESAAFAQDINFNGASNDSPFTGFNDWAKIDLRQISARRNVHGFSVDVWGSGDIGSGGSGDIGSGGSGDIGSGGSGDIGSGGSGDIGSGGSELDFDAANSTVDPPTGLTAVTVKAGRNVTLTWNAPKFGQIRTYYVWRVDITKVPISPTNPPVKIGTLTGTPPVTTFIDGTVKNNATYKYFVTSALGNGTQSPVSTTNTVTITVTF